MTTIDVGVLGVQGDIEEHEAVVRMGYERMGLAGRVSWVKTRSQAENLHGLIVPGGESTAIGRLAEKTATLETLRTRIEHGLPTLGTCAGLIMLANRVYDSVAGEIQQPLLGGLDITVERNAFGRQRESFEADLSLPELGQAKFRGVFIRSPVVKQVSSKVQVLSRLEERIVAVRQENIIGTAFHPELSGDARIHEYFLGLVLQSPLLH